MFPKKIRVAVLMGGPSAEHAVSLKTGQMVLKSLNPNTYHAAPVVISKTGKWPIRLVSLKRDFDIAFIAMHGEYGEDGTVQAVLEKNKIPYTGSNARASRLGMDKIKSASFFRRAGLIVPLHQIIRKWAKKKVSVVRLPAVVKPADRGSSVGLSIVKNPRDIKNALTLSFRYSPTALVQHYIPGRELTCGVVEIGPRLLALPPTEIIPKKSSFFDYYSKYTPGASREITPAPLPKSIAKKIQSGAQTAHKAIGARGYSRSDFILGRDHTLYILEINTLPGLTPTSLLPQEAAAAGIPFSKLLDFIIESAMKTH